MYLIVLLDELTNGSPAFSELFCIFSTITFFVHCVTTAARAVSKARNFFIFSLQIEMIVFFL